MSIPPIEDSLSVKVISRSLVCENSKFHIYFDHVLDLINKNEVLKYLVVSPKYSAPNLVTGVAVLPIIRRHVGLIRIYRPAIRSFSWEIPHGFIEGGECANISASRELLEETGLYFKAENFNSLGCITPDPGVLAARIDLYFVSGDHELKSAEDEIGLRGFQFFSFEMFEKMIDNSEVQDGITLSAWCKYKRLNLIYGNIR